MKERKAIRKGLALALVLVLVAAMFVVILPMNVGADWTGDVTIQWDGTVVPSGAPISVSGSTYTLTDDILGTITIEKPSITLDGDGYMIKGDGTKTGIYGTGLSDLEIKELNVLNHNIGIRFDYTTDSTIIENTITDITRAGIAIWYSTSTGNTISKNAISDCGWGMVLIYGANSNTISENTIHGYNSGIQLSYYTHSNTLRDNVIRDAYHGAIYQLFSSSNTITGNKMTDNGIIIWGSSLSYWNTHTIDTTNTVNGDPVYYWKDIDGGKVPKGAGQVILANCNKVKVTGQDIENADQGIVLGFSTNCKITDNKVSGCNYNIHLSYSSTNNAVCDNTVSGGSWGIYLMYCSNNKVNDNTVTDLNVGIRLYISGSCDIKDNLASENYYGLFTYRSDSNSFKENAFSNNVYGAWMQDSSTNTIKENTVTDNENGLHVLAFSYPSTGNIICENTVSGTKYWGGIYLQEAHGNTIKDNKLSKNDGGIWLWGANSNIVEDNTASENKYGIAITGSSSNMVSSNKVTKNEYGIYLDPDLVWLNLYSNYNTICKNDIKQNSYGIYLDTSDSNTFYYNNIFKNKDQLESISSTNTWDNGAGEGNYWSDYKGKDTDNDGVGDTMLPHQGVDNYPLMKPVK